MRERRRVMSKEHGVSVPWERERQPCTATWRRPCQTDTEKQWACLERWGDYTVRMQEKQSVGWQVYIWRLFMKRVERNQSLQQYFHLWKWQLQYSYKRKRKMKQNEKEKEREQPIYYVKCKTYIQKVIIRLPPLGTTTSTCLPSLLCPVLSMFVCSCPYGTVILGPTSLSAALLPAMLAAMLLFEKESMSRRTLVVRFEESAWFFFLFHPSQQPLPAMVWLGLLPPPCHSLLENHVKRRETQVSHGRIEYTENYSPASSPAHTMPLEPVQY